VSGRLGVYGPGKPDAGSPGHGRPTLPGSGPRFPRGRTEVLVDGGTADIMTGTMWRLGTSVSRVIGVASLTLLATSVPPSARPAAPVSRPEPADTNSKADRAPLQESDKRDRSSDPALVVSVDLGNIWDKAAEVRGGEPCGHCRSDLRRPERRGGSVSAAWLGAEMVRPGAVERDAVVVVVPAGVIRSPRAFLTADRAQGPPCV
jgi:hypothetical protein